MISHAHIVGAFPSKNFPKMEIVPFCYQEAADMIGLVGPQTFTRRSQASAGSARMASKTPFSLSIPFDTLCILLLIPAGSS